MAAVTEVEDLRRLAWARLPRALFDYVEGGSWSEATLRSNVEALQRLRLRQRVGVDVAERSTATTLLGQHAAMPVAIAPVGLLGLLRADGEIAMARAAESFGVPFTLAMLSICSLEDIARHSRSPFWFQVSMLRDRGAMEVLIERARVAGCSALLVSMDLPVLGQRLRDARNGLNIPIRPKLSNLADLLSRPRWCMDRLSTRRHSFGNLAGLQGAGESIGSLSVWIRDQLQPSFTWADIDWIKQRWCGRLVLKGILDADDARAAADCGVDAVIVSNHGGRQLDGAVSGIEALPAVVDAVGARLEVWMDGGIRCGQDVVKACALGARGTLIGRAAAYGLAAQGQSGVQRVLKILQQDLDLSMALLGCRSIQALKRDVLLPAMSADRVDRTAHPA